MGLTVFSGGTILVHLPLVGEASTANAMAFAEGRVVSVGDEALSLAERDGAEVVDLDGGVLLPGLGDGHAHPVLGGLEANGPRVRAQPDLESVIAEVGRWRRQHPEAEWIVGASYDSTFAPGGLFDAHWLDEVTGDTPTILRAWDYHTAWVNSAALAAGGITAETPDPEHGRIVRREDGSPLGTLQEAAANDFIAHVVPRFSLDARVSAIETATREYAALGTTWVQDAWVDAGNLDTYRVAARDDRLHTRVNLAFRADPRHWREQVAEFEGYRRELRELGHERLSGKTVKFFVDGVIENHTAALTAPYADRPDDHGLPNWSAVELAEAVQAFDADGFQLHLHAIGDAATRIALDALETATARIPARDRSSAAAGRAHVIAHVAMLAPGQAERFAELGVIANFEPYWAQCDAAMKNLTIPHIGREREGWQYLIGSVLRSGATVSFGSDWPVTTKDWRPALSTAITRRSHLDSDADPWLPDERISAVSALAAYTSGIGRQALANDRGSLTVGSVADAAWLSENPISIDPSRIPEIEIRGTWLAGHRTK